MAISAQWDEVMKRLDYLEQYDVLHPTLEAQRGVVAALRGDPGFADVQPGLSHATLTLRIRDRKRGVMVSWDDERKRFDVAFLDPGLEIVECRGVPPPEVVATVIEYLDRIRS